MSKYYYLLVEYVYPFCYHSFNCKFKICTVFQTITESCTSDKVEIFKTLSKYIFAEMDTPRMNPNTVYTVMPGTV